MHIRQTSRGFSLIELLFVVMIIGIITAIVIPNYLRFANRAKEAVVKENMHTVHLAIEAYSVQTLGVYPQPADEPVLKTLMPQNLYPTNPFSNVETVMSWNADPALPGDMGLYNLPGGGYRLRGQGATAFLDDIIQGN